jgi:CO/xanthine dehydrogenase Mo-binding subunit
VLIAEYCGGGFGSKGAGAVTTCIPALLSKKANAPVMMRVSREEESYFGRARTNMTGRVKIGFAKDGRLTAMTCTSCRTPVPMGRSAITGRRAWRRRSRISRRRCGGAPST